MRAELYSVISRTTNVSGLEAQVEYMIDVSGAKIAEMRWEEVFRRFYVLTGELRLKT